MSKPRYRWWGYIKGIIRDYPGMQGKALKGVRLRERESVRRAIQQTRALSDGPDREKVVELVFFKQTHTLEGAARMVPCGYETAKRWAQQFIKLVAKNYGLMD